jgi:hypothetical protein
MIRWFSSHSGRTWYAVRMKSRMGAVKTAVTGQTAKDAIIGTGLFGAGGVVGALAFGCLAVWLVLALLITLIWALVAVLASVIPL